VSGDPLAPFEDAGGPIELVVFDADGTLRGLTVPGRVCPYGPDEWVLLPHVRETLARVDWSRRAVATASNQDHVGYGHLSAAMAERLLGDALQAALGVARPPTRIGLCPHRIEEACACRKPAPGMLLDAMEHFAIQPARTLFVGDATCDAQAAAAAGVRFAWASSLFRAPREVDLSK
jgi:histidinol-phosphate phosphatase family protein